ncbi:MAG: tRNA 2-thiocytidine(32) synthetase TtcA [Deltaproteobacteria bacterium]|nr:tRNA 2-thiocytidine(32) synthetase TtcA [Deltaproteobacteria bacterium]MCL5792126.1 tRNA 2-thiocytidine(32) synthetase TtcA [Deltaproteobacteria bacterium]
MNIYNRNIVKAVGRAIGDFDLIHEGDKILVAVSGGKDSYTLLDALEKLRHRSPVKYDLTAVHIDTGAPGMRSDLVEQFLKSHSYDYIIERTEIMRISVEYNKEDKLLCSLCSRLRRGYLYSLSQKHGFNKIALGHNMDDLIETLFLNIFFTGQIKAMPAISRSGNYKVTVIRPLIYVKAKDALKYAVSLEAPLIDPECPVSMSGRLENRRKIRNLISNLEKEYPYIKNTIFASLKHVNKDYLLDKRLFNDNIAKE